MRDHKIQLNFNQSEWDSIQEAAAFHKLPVRIYIQRAAAGTLEMKAPPPPSSRKEAILEGDPDTGKAVEPSKSDWRPPATSPDVKKKE